MMTRKIDLTTFINNAAKAGIEAKLRKTGLVKIEKKQTGMKKNPENKSTPLDLSHEMRTQLQPYFKEVFKTCVFCEEMMGSQIDHYRPKGAVKEFSSGKRKPVYDEHGKKHPGYYWLTYEITNLLWVCGKCNGKKGDRFPIRGERCFDYSANPQDWRIRSGALVKEKPLLMNPLIHRPEDHLTIDFYGNITDESEIGRTTIEVCELNRADLVEERKKCIINIFDELTDSLKRFKFFLKYLEQDLSLLPGKKIKEIYWILFGGVFDRFKRQLDPKCRFFSVYRAIDLNFEMFLKENSYIRPGMTAKDRLILVHAFKVFSSSLPC